MKKRITIEPDDIEVIEWDRHNIYKDRKAVLFYLKGNTILELQLTTEQVYDLKCQP